MPDPNNTLLANPNAAGMGGPPSPEESAPPFANATVAQAPPPQLYRPTADPSIQPSPAAAGDVSQMAQQNPQAMQQAPVAGQQMTPEGEDALHSAALGHGFKSIMRMLGSGQANSFFRSVLAGAMTGAAAGSENANAGPAAGSGWAAAGRGMGAVQQQEQIQQKEAQAKQQQDFENQLKTEQESRAQAQEDREATLNKAQIAMWHQQLAMEQHKSDMLDQEAIDKKNELSAALYKTYKDAGGAPPTDGTPDTISAYDLANKYVASGGKIAEGPNGTHRIFFDSTNGGEAQRDPITGKWYENGKEVDMTHKTEFKVLDVPKDSMNEKVPRSAAEVNKILGYNAFPDGKATVMISPSQLQDLVYKKRLMDDKRNETAVQANAERHAEWDALYKTYTAQRESLAGQLATLKADTSLGNYHTQELQSLQKQYDDNENELVRQRDRLFPNLKNQPVTRGGPPAPAEDPSAKILSVAQGITDGNKALEMIKNAPGISKEQRDSLVDQYMKWLAQKQATPTRPIAPPAVLPETSGIAGSFQ